MTCWVITPRTIASSIAVRGIEEKLEGRLLAAPKKAAPAASPNPLGMTTATLVLPCRTASRASSTDGVVSFRLGSAWAPATIAFEMALSSWSTIAAPIRGGSRLCGPEKSEPKNEAMAIGTTKLTITERRSLKKRRRSLRTMAKKGVRAISPAGSFP